MTDTELLDWLQAKNDEARYTGMCVLRDSTTGRGWRLHETSQSGATSSVRQAILNAIPIPFTPRESDESTAEWIARAGANPEAEARHAEEVDRIIERENPNPQENPS